MGTTCARTQGERSAAQERAKGSLANAGLVTPEQELEAIRAFTLEWLVGGSSCWRGACFHLERGSLRKAAELLREAAESYYRCSLLVCTFQAPDVHDLERLRLEAERIDKALAEVWAPEDLREEGLLEKLGQFGLSAQRTRRSQLSAEELRCLAAKVQNLETRVEMLCWRRAAEVQRKASGAA